MLCGYVHVRLWIVSVVVGRGGVVWVCACEVVDSKCGGGERGVVYVHVRVWIVSVVVGRGGVVWVCACEGVDSKCGGGERGCCVGMCM